MRSFLRPRVAPSNLVTLSDAKAHLRVTGSFEDALIEDYIAAASSAIDGPYGMAGVCFGAQTWDFVCSHLRQRFVINVAGATAITDFKYFDADDVEQTLTAADFFYIVPRFDGISMRVKDGAQLPTTNDRDDAVTITVTAPARIPIHIRHACLMTVAAWFDGREIGEIPQGAKTLIDIERVGWAAA